MRPQTLTLTTLLTVALGISGCGLTQGEDSERASEEAPSESADAEESADASESTDAEESTDTDEVADVEEADSTDADEDAAPAGEQGAPVAVRRGSIDGESVSLELIELDRSGDTTVLNLRVAALGETESSIGGQISDTFDDGVAQGDDDAELDGSTLDGISLIDSQNRRRYLVARDSTDTCVCDGNLGGAFVEQGAPLTLSATFGAPPEDVEAVDVVVPSFGTFRDVPLS